MRRLASAGERLADIPGSAQSALAKGGAPTVPARQPRPYLVASKNDASPVTDELASAMAEIEQATAVLRRVEPTLEHGYVETMPSVPDGRPRAVWIVMGILWLSAVLGAAGLIFTVASFAG
jgi:hypothetical protein